MARIRNQNSGPMRRSPRPTAAPRCRFDASISDKRRRTRAAPRAAPRSRSPPSTSRATSRARRRANTAQTTSAPPARRVLAAHVEAREVEHEVRDGDRERHDRGDRDGERALAGRERLELRAGGLVALARARVAARARAAAGPGAASPAPAPCAAYGFACPRASSSAARSARAAASGSSASAIARTTTTRVAPRAATSATLPASRPPIANHGLRACPAA